MLITFEQAAKALGYSERSVRALYERGLLRIEDDQGVRKINALHLRLLMVQHEMDTELIDKLLGGES